MRLTDEQWALIQPLLPPPSPASRGRPPLDRRAILDGIFWKLSTLSPWYDIPSCYPSYQSCYRHYRKWQRLGLLNTIRNALFIDLRDRGGVDLNQIKGSGPIHFVTGSPQLELYIDPSLKDSWQLSTAMLFIAPLIQKLRQELYRRYGSSYYARTRSRPAPDIDKIKLDTRKLVAKLNKRYHLGLDPLEDENLTA